MKKYTLFIVIILIFSSCADQYSRRRRTISPDTKYYKSREVIDVAQKEEPIEDFDNNSPQDIIEIVEDEPVLDVLEEEIPKNTKTEKVLGTAYTYLGTPYRYGGTTRSGIDCSGLVGNAFREVDIPLARSAFDMSNQGEPISLKEVEVGDLLFFATRRRNKISHVGIVVEIVGNEIKFIHSSTSRGVIVSSLDETYWSRAFRKAKRVL